MFIKETFNISITYPTINLKGNTWFLRHESSYFTYLEVFIDMLLVYIDYFGLKYICVLPWL